MAPNRCQVVAPGLTTASKLAPPRAPKLHDPIFQERLVSPHGALIQAHQGAQTDISPARSVRSWIVQRHVVRHDVSLLATWTVAINGLSDTKAGAFRSTSQLPKFRRRNRISASASEVCIRSLHAVFEPPPPIKLSSFAVSHIRGRRFAGALVGATYLVAPFLSFFSSCMMAPVWTSERRDR